MTDLASRPDARPLIADAEPSAFPEPHVERWPLGDRAAIWIIAAIGPWVGIAWAVKIVGGW